NRRQLNSLQNTWPYGYSMPIAVRYTQDAFSRSGWLWPVDAKGEPLKATSYMAVGFYVAKYVNKKSDMDLAAKGLGAKEWNNSLKTKLSLLPKKLFRIRMSSETITSIILIKLIRVSLGTVRHPRRFKIVVIDIQITLKQMLRDFI